MNARTLKQTFDEIDRIAAILGLPGRVRETAIVMYRQAINNDLLRGRSIKVIGASTLCDAARQTNTQMSLEEVAAVGRVDKNEVVRVYRNITRERFLKIHPNDPTGSLPRFSSSCEVSIGTKTRAQHLLEVTIARCTPSGKSPIVLAATAIYTPTRLTREDLTRANLSGAPDVRKLTNRNRYQELLQEINSENTTNSLP